MTPISGNKNVFKNYKVILWVKNYFNPIKSYTACDLLQFGYTQQTSETYSKTDSL